MKRLARLVSGRKSIERAKTSSPSPGKMRFKFFALSIILCCMFAVLPIFFTSGASSTQKQATGSKSAAAVSSAYKPTWSQAYEFHETPALRDVVPAVINPEWLEKYKSEHEDEEKNEQNLRPVKKVVAGKTARFTDPAINNSKKPVGSPNAVTNPIANFDGIDADQMQALFGGRAAPPDTNAAVGPNHVIITTNGGLRIFDKSGTPLTAPLKLSSFLVGVPNAADDDGDPVVNYDPLADRWILSQFNLQVTTNSTHQHFAVSKTSDPTGQYYAYDFLLAPNRPGDYPHVGVWPDGYYMSTNDFSLPPLSNPFQGAGLYAFERAKMLVGDPTAKVIGFSTDNTHGGMLPSNFQGLTPPPVGTPNLFGEFDADAAQSRVRLKISKSSKSPDNLKFVKMHFVTPSKGVTHVLHDSDSVFR